MRFEEEPRYPKRLSVSFSAEVGAELDAIADKVHVPVAQIVRLCVEQGLPVVRAAADRRDAQGVSATPKAPGDDPETAQ
ncbi:MAG: hypothetical protein OXC31_11855 [Spirochaetaceae bacterium]|nr:hypothetical protein [Spirochaetaceae bacterium]